ncbi:MAG TPA: hypothetical protein VMS55_13945 [Myxococcota bacterium]|nr:hypothetical protein [Myxococcota bacterium]
MQRSASRRVAAVLYWLAAITIALGAFGHGFVGIVPVRAAFEVLALPPDVMRVLWIVWYFVSACMLFFGALLAWAWPRLQAGAPSRSGAALAIGVLYVVTGVASFLYTGEDRFWLLFVAQGALVVGSTFVLRGSRIERASEMR